MDGTVTFEIKGSNEVVRQYTLKPIQRWEAIWVMDTFLKTAAGAMVQGMDALISVVSKSGGLLQSNIRDMANSLGSVTRSLDFQQHKQVATLLFTGGVVRSLTSDPIMGDTCTVEFGEAFETLGGEYFRENPLEFYVATFLAIDRNWPGFFTELRARIDDLKQVILPGKKSKESSE